MPKRVAITIAGAVSLGSYEAGVLYELLRAFRINNDEAGNDETKKIYIDVITGASAGAMTAAMVAKALIYDPASLNGELTNPLYKAWVEEISLLGLAKMKWSEPKWHSLFSSDLIARIGDEKLVKITRNGDGNPHATIDKKSEDPILLRLGMALTNLGGIDYMIRIEGNDDGGFNYTTSLDQKTFGLTHENVVELLPKNAQHPCKWEEVCLAAIGSGAFPAAFRPQAITHKAAEYGVALPKEEKDWKEGEIYVDWRKKSTDSPFAHSDGGILQNQPLGIAKNLVDEAVNARGGGVCDSDERLYVFVAPHSVKSSAQQLDADKITIWHELKLLFSVFRRQAMFHDWITAEQMNRNITILDLRAGQLKGAIEASRIKDLDGLEKAAKQLNDLLMGGNHEDRVNRLRAQYSGEYSALLKKGEAAANGFIEAIATLEAAAQLNDHDQMNIIAVIANEKTQLMGSGFAAFVGFFNKKFREHDYWMGRKLAKKYLRRGDVKKILGITDWPEEVEVDLDPDDPTGLTPPPGPLLLLRSGFWPLIIMIAIRPAMWGIPALVAFGIWALIHFYH